MGEAPGALAELPPGIPLPAPQPARLNDWSTQAEASGWTCCARSCKTRIASHEIQIARSGHMPTLNLRASSGSATDGVLQGTGPGRPIENTVGVTLSIPLYAGGGISSQVTEKSNWNKRPATTSRTRGARPCNRRACTTTVS